MIGLLVAVVALVGIGAVVGFRAVRARRVRQLHAAVWAGDVQAVRRLAGRDGRRLNLPGPDDGNAALHVAYYAARYELIDELVSLGAATALPNRCGLVPSQMSHLRHAEELFDELAALLDPEAGWRAVEQARKVYEELWALGPVLVTLAVENALAVTPAERRRPLVLTAIKLGDVVQLGVLAKLLWREGTPELAADLLRSGSPFLARTAERWGRSPHRELPAVDDGESRARWGEF